MKAEQGDVIKVENLKGLFFVASNDFFNGTQQAVLCPLVNNTFPDPLHISVKTDDLEGIVMCEQVRMFDLRARGWKKTGRLAYSDVINLTDAIQSIFDY